jgi:hypothetical protein
VDGGKLIKFKDIKGTVFMADGDEMHVKLPPRFSAD